MQKLGVQNVRDYLLKPQLVIISHQLVNTMSLLQCSLTWDILAYAQQCCLPKLDEDQRDRYKILKIPKLLKFKRSRAQWGIWNHPLQRHDVTIVI